MNGTTNEFQSQMTFLKRYSENYYHRAQLIAEKRKMLEDLKPSVDQSNLITEEIEDLKAQNKIDEKFLISMNDMVLRNTGEPISNGPLFEETAGTSASLSAGAKGETGEKTE